MATSAGQWRHQIIFRSYLRIWTQLSSYCIFFNSSICTPSRSLGVTLAIGHNLWWCHELNDFNEKLQQMLIYVPLTATSKSFHIINQGTEEGEKKISRLVWTHISFSSGWKETAKISLKDFLYLPIFLLNYIADKWTSNRHEGIQQKMEQPKDIEKEITRELKIPLCTSPNRLLAG